MRKTLLIAARDYNASVRTKGFIIGLVLLPFLLGGSIIIIKLMEGRVDTRDRRIAVIDRTGVVAPALVEAGELRSGDGQAGPPSLHLRDRRARGGGHRGAAPRTLKQSAGRRALRIRRDRPGRALCRR